MKKILLFAFVLFSISTFAQKTYCDIAWAGIFQGDSVYHPGDTLYMRVFAETGCNDSFNSTITFKFEFMRAEQNGVSDTLFSVRLPLKYMRSGAAYNAIDERPGLEDSYGLYRVIIPSNLKGSNEPVYIYGWDWRGKKIFHTFYIKEQVTSLTDDSYYSATDPILKYYDLQGRVAEPGRSGILIALHQSGKRRKVWVSE